MHPFSVFAFGIFVAGYITARWDLVTRLYDLAIFAWDHGVVVSTHRLHQCTTTVADERFSGAYCKRIRHPFPLLLPIRYTDRETRIEGDALGGEHTFCRIRWN